MKREQNYEVTITHKAHAKVLVRAASRELAKKEALRRYHSDYDIELINDSEGDKATKVKCLGTAEKTKKR